MKLLELYDVCMWKQTFFARIKIPLLFCAASSATTCMSPLWLARARSRVVGCALFVVVCFWLAFVGLEVVVLGRRCKRDGPVPLRIQWFLRFAEPTHFHLQPLAAPDFCSQASRCAAALGREGVQGIHLSARRKEQLFWQEIAGRMHGSQLLSSLHERSYGYLWLTLTRFGGCVLIGRVLATFCRYMFAPVRRCIAFGPSPNTTDNH